MLKKASVFCIYAAIATPLLVNKSLYFPFIAGKALFFRSFVELALFFCIGAILFGEIKKDAIFRIIRRPIFIISAVFTAFFIITCLTAVNPSFALWSNFERGEGGWQVLHYFLFFGLLAVLFNSEGQWRRVIGWQVIVSVFVALYAVGQGIDWPSFVFDPPAGAISGTLGNPSYLGSYLLFSAMLALWLAFSKNINFIWLFITIFEFSVFFAAKTRGSLAALALGIVIMAFAWIFLHKKRGSTLLTTAALSLGMIGLLSYVIATVKGDAIASLQPRFWAWKSAVLGILDKPIFGWGIENFPFIFDTYYDPRHYEIQTWFDRAHNAILEYATSGGIPLAILYLGIFFILYRELLKMPNKTGLWPLFAALPAMYLTNGLVLFEILPIYLILFLLLALYLHYTADFKLIDEKNTIPITHPPVPASAYALCALSGIAIAASLYFTAYLPYHKNKLLLTALKPDNKTDQQIFQEYENVLSYYSPVGQQEAVQNLFEFTNTYMEFVEKEISGAIQLEKLKQIMTFNDEWYQKSKDSGVGIKLGYGYAWTLITAARVTGEKEYLEKARVLSAEGAEKAPKRIEFVILDMKAARVLGDEAFFQRALQKGKNLRPDLPWDAIIKNINA